jgi:S-formylglutathione hydrolase FrmB
MILLHLDGDGPLGDPYQVNSANHGPYGDALVKELIPHVEREFRVIGAPHARVLDGVSTGGWVSLALQIFYPDLFNGTWSLCPDGVDFRGFQLLNIYEDKNAYVNAHGFDRPSARDANGDVLFTMRHEVQLENVLGRGDSWTMSGGQWGAWNATYSSRGSDGRPVALWNRETGVIDRMLTEHWKQYDLRLVLEANWSTLAPKLRGKIHVAASDADNFFLNNAARMLETFFQKAQPPYEGRMTFAPRQGHCQTDLTDMVLLKEMGARTGARP